jgi:hypothetical protein
MTNICQQKVTPMFTRADDSFAKGIRRLLCLRLHGDAWVGQKHSRASAPSQERISAILATSTTDEG